MEEYFGEDYDDYPEEYLPYQAKIIFNFEVFFEYFRETILRITSLPAKKIFWGPLEYFGDYGD
jgi:hypothetical protein